eukprot:165927-Hanusia_phi.AAC.1
MFNFPVVSSGTKVVSLISGEHSFLSTNFSILVSPDPMIREIRPSVFPTRGGTLAHVFGSYMLKTSIFGFEHNVIPTTSIVSSTLLQVIVPPLNSGTFQVWMSQGGGQQIHQGVHVLYSALPSIKRALPSMCTSAGMVPITIVGKHFSKSLDWICRFGLTKIVPGQYLSSSLLKCDAPSHEPGNVVVAVSFNRLDFTESTVIIEYYSSVMLGSLMPSFGPKSGSSLVSVSGSGFQAERSLSCSFGDLTTPATVIHQRILVCKTPSQNPGLVDFALSNRKGMKISVASLEYEYTNLCPILQVSPSSASTKGTTEVKLILGCDYPQSALCRFGNLTAPAYFLTGSSLLCVAPRAESSMVSLDVVSNDFSVVSISTLFQFQHGARVSAVFPTSISHSSPFQGQITVLGEYFSYSSRLGCRLGGRTVLQAYWQSSTSLTCPLVTMAPGNVTVEVTNDGHDYSKEYSFVHVLPDQRPDIILHPTYGPTTGGTEITIIGVDISTVRFENVLASCRTNKASTLCTIPAHDAGLIQVQTACHQADSFSTSFLYVSVPSVSEVYPSIVSQQQRSLITVMGAGFVNEISFVCLFENDSPSQTPATIASSNAATCFTPSLLAGEYTVRLTCSERSVYSHSSLTVVSAPQPVVIKLLPSLHFTNSKSVVTVFGQNFLKNDGLACKVQSTVIRALWIDNQALICQLPQLNFVGNATLEVSNNGIEYPVNPTIISVVSRTTLVGIEPSTSWEMHAIMLTVTGNHMMSDIELICKFNVRKVSVAIPISSTKVICNMPPLLSGRISVMLSSQVTKMNSNTVFVQILSSVADGISSPAEPSSGPPAGGTRVFIKGEFHLNSAYACSFDKARVAGVLVSSSLLQCVSPAGNEGCVQVSVLEGVSDEVVLLQRRFCYENVAFIESIFPDRAHWTERVVVKVLGGAFLDTTDLCGRIGDLAMPCRWISSSQARCFVTFRAPGRYLFEISNNCEDFSGQGVPFIAENLVRIVDIKPTAGFSTGGNEIIVLLQPKLTETVENSSRWKWMCQFNELLSTAELEQVGTDTEHVRCIQPACVPTESATFRLLHQGLSFTNTVEFPCRDPCMVYSITPSVGPVEGGTRISVSGVGFNKNASSCYLGLIKSTGYFISSKLFICISPIALDQTGTMVMLQVTNVNDLLDAGTGSLPFRYEEHVIVSRIVPQVLTSSGPKHVMVYGSGFRLGSVVSCRFGIQVLQSIAVISSTNLLCSTPYFGHDQNISFEISNNGIDFSNSGLRISLANPMIRIIAHPKTFSIGTSEVITIMGSERFPDAYIACRFGEEALPARQIDSTRIWCNTPRFEHIGPTSVEVVAMYRELQNVLGKVDIVVHGAINVTAMIPTSGPTIGGTLLSIIGTNMPSEGFAFKLQSQEHVIEQVGITLSSTVVLCSTPPIDRPSTYRLDFGDEVVRTQPLQFSFQYYLQPRIFHVTPIEGAAEGGTKVTLFGEYFMPWTEVSCAFGDGLSSSEIVTSTFVVCTAPAHEPGNVSISLSFNLHDYTSSGASFHYLAPNQVLVLHPSVGPINGGTYVTLSGAKFSASQDIVLMFGTVLVKSETRGINGEARFIVPPSSAQTGADLIYLTVTTDLANYTRQVSFEYLPAFHIDYGTPSMVSMSLGQAITLVGHGFHQANVCILPTEVLPAHTAFISSTMLLCYLDSLKVGKYEISIAMHDSIQSYKEDFVVTIVQVPSLTQVIPSGVPAYMSFSLTMIGSYFYSSNQLSCQVGNQLRHVAEYVTSSKALCNLPEMKPSN